MGARGPAKSPRLKVVRGEGVSVEQPAGTAAAEVQPGLPKKPKSVEQNAALSQWWDDIVPGMAESGFLATADTAAIVELLQHLHLSHEAFRLVQQEGLTMLINEEKPEHGSKKNPAEAIMRMESEQVLKYSRELGATWMARARTAVPTGGSDSGNPFESAASG